MALPAAAVAALPLAGLWARRARRGHPAAWVGCLLHLGLAVTVASRYGLPWPSGTDEDPSGTLHVMSLNAGRDGPQSRAATAAELRVRPDLVVMQEASLMIITAGTGEEGLAGSGPTLTVAGSGLAAPPTRSDPADPAERMPVFALQPAVSFTPVELDPSPDDLSGRAVRAVVRWRGLDVAVYNVHLRSFGPERPWASSEPWSRASVRGAIVNFRTSVLRRAAEADQLRAAVDAETLPYLIVGDFNSTPQQWTYHRLASGHTESARRAGWFRASYPARLPLVSIDHILGGPGWSLRKTHIGGGGLSDHRPVHGWLRWDGAFPDSTARRIDEPAEAG